MPSRRTESDAHSAPSISDRSACRTANTSVSDKLVRLAIRRPNSSVSTCDRCTHCTYQSLGASGSPTLLLRYTPCQRMAITVPPWMPLTICNLTSAICNHQCRIRASANVVVVRVSSHSIGRICPSVGNHADDGYLLLSAATQPQLDPVLDNRARLSMDVDLDFELVSRPAIPLCG